MVLSVYDIDDYRSYFDVHPIRKVANETTGYDCLLMGTRFGIGFIKDGQIVERPQYELDVKGRIRCKEMFTVSDEREKCGIEPMTLPECAEVVGNINIYRYGFNTRPDARKIGFIAQDLELTTNGIVNDQDHGMKSIDTTQILAAAVGAIKHLQDRLTFLENKVLCCNNKQCEQHDVDFNETMRDHDVHVAPSLSNTAKGPSTNTT